MRSGQNGRAAQELGGMNELRFFEAFQAPGWTHPPWYQGLRRATKEEDSKGIDAVMSTTAGDILIQVKSSIRGKQVHEERYGHAHIVVVVREGLNPHTIRTRTLARVAARRRNRHKSAKRKEKKQRV